MKSDDQNGFILPERKRPAKDRPLSSFECSIVFVTVCTKDRKPLLANSVAHQTLIALWSDAAFWAVGRYVIMPDHIHLFAREASWRSPSISRWVGWWKREFSKCIGLHGVWQQGLWDTRLYRLETYLQKVEYVRTNPVRAELVTDAEQWQYQGAIHTFKWF